MSDIATAIESLDWSNTPIGHKEVLRAAIAALRAAEEPVATVAVIGAGGHRWLVPHPLNALDALPVGTPLYTTPTTRLTP